MKKKSGSIRATIAQFPAEKAGKEDPNCLSTNIQYTLYIQHNTYIHYTY